MESDLQWLESLISLILIWRTYLNLRQLWCSPQIGGYRSIVSFYGYLPWRGCMHPSQDTAVPALYHPNPFSGPERPLFPGSFIPVYLLPHSKLDCRAASNKPMNPGIGIFRGHLSIRIRVVKHSMAQWLWAYKLASGGISLTVTPPIPLIRGTQIMGTLWLSRELATILPKNMAALVPGVAF